MKHWHQEMRVQASHGAHLHEWNEGQPEMFDVNLYSGKAACAPLLVVVFVVLGTAVVAVDCKVLCRVHSYIAQAKSELQWLRPCVGSQISGTVPGKRG